MGVFARVLFAVFLGGITTSVRADDALDNALRATYTACVGIDDELHDMRVMAGINTAVTSVGSATGVGATTVGFVKAAKDKKIEELEKIIAEIDRLQRENPENGQIDADKFLAEFGAYYDTAVKNVDKYKTEIDRLNDQSIKLGNWRTGLLAGTAATNIAGTVIASVNRVDAELSDQVANCVKSVKALRGVMMQSRLNGTDISEAEQIASACGEYEYVDLKPINKRALGAAISGGIGAGAAIAGTVTSAVANDTDIRGDNSDAGKKKEKDLNTASNVLSAGATAASITATVFNATQIAAIKKVSAVAQQCTGVLR